jgi:[ribosomal protein S5]-alanine N-acetyltransferase
MMIHLTHALLRPWQRGDEQSCAKHANDRGVWRNLRDTFPHPYTPADTLDWIERNEALPRRTNFVIIVDGEAAGGIGIMLREDVDRRTAEIGYWLGRAHWGRGIATEAVRAVSKWAFTDFDLIRLEAGVFGWNPAPARVLEKAGYTLEGRLRDAITKDGETTDRMMYSLLRQEADGI